VTNTALASDVWPTITSCSEKLPDVTVNVALGVIGVLSTPSNIPLILNTSETPRDISLLS